MQAPAHLPSLHTGSCEQMHNKIPVSKVSLSTRSHESSGEHSRSHSVATVATLVHVVTAHNLLHTQLNQTMAGLGPSRFNFLGRAECPCTVHPACQRLLETEYAPFNTHSMTRTVLDSSLA